LIADKPDQRSLSRRYLSRLGWLALLFAILAVLVVLPLPALVLRGFIAIDGGHTSASLPEDTKQDFGGQWFRTKDVASRDKDGYFWYVGRNERHQGVRLSHWTA